MNLGSFARRSFACVYACLLNRRPYSLRSMTAVSPDAERPAPLNRFIQNSYENGLLYGKRLLLIGSVYARGSKKTKPLSCDPSMRTAMVRSVQGVPVPAFFYGTAWKEERTEALARRALDAGFRAIDTANQRLHYVEAGVGAAVASAIRDGIVARSDLFLQTKFTSRGGQDHRLPYDPDAETSVQVRQSFERSL